MNQNGFVKEASAYTSIDKTYEWLSTPKNKICVLEYLLLDVSEILMASQDHNPEWKVEEQEILDQLYKGWLQYWNHESVNDAVNGMAGARRFYDFDQMLSYDMFGNTPRGHFGEHFDAIFPYWGDGQMDFKDIEITCLSKDAAFSIMIQHTWGTAGGTPFATTFRRTGITKKRDGKWKWIHEHLSYPADMKTGKADFTCGLDPTKAFKFQ